MNQHDVFQQRIATALEVIALAVMEIATYGPGLMSQGERTALAKHLGWRLTDDGVLPVAPAEGSGQ